MGSTSPTGRGNFWDCLAQWKALGVSAAVYAAQSLMTPHATSAADCNALDWSESQYIVPREKSPCDTVFNQNCWWVVIIRPYRMHCIDPAYCYRCRTWSVCVYVFVLVAWMCFTKSGWTDRDTFWGLTRLFPRNHVAPMADLGSGDRVGHAPSPTVENHTR